MSIFCRHKWDLKYHTKLWLYDEIFGRSNGNFYYDDITYRVEVVCNKCGKIKKLTAKNTKINWYSEKNFNLLSETEKSSFTIKKNNFLKKIQKKYGITID